MYFSEEESGIISKIYFDEIIKNMDVIDLLIIQMLLDGESNNTAIEKLEYSEKGYYKRKNKLKEKFKQYYKTGVGK